MWGDRAFAGSDSLAGVCPKPLAGRWEGKPREGLSASDPPLVTVPHTLRSNSLGPFPFVSVLQTHTELFIDPERVSRAGWVLRIHALKGAACVPPRSRGASSSS